MLRSKVICHLKLTRNSLSQSEIVRSIIPTNMKFLCLPGAYGSAKVRTSVVLRPSHNCITTNTT